MRFKKKYVISSIILTVIFIVTLFINVLVNKKTSPFNPLDIQTEQRNYSIAVDNKTSRLIIGTYENTAIAYDENLKEMWRLDTRGPVKEIKICDSNNKVYIGSEDRNLYVVNFDTGEVEDKIPVNGKIYSIDINEDASRIIISAGVSAMKHKIYLFDGDANLLWKKNYDITYEKVSFNYDGSAILAGNSRAELKLFDLAGNEQKNIKLDYNIVNFQVSNENNIVLITEDGRFYNIDNEFKVLNGVKLNNNTYALVANRDVSKIVVCSYQGDIYFMDKEGNAIYTTSINKQISGATLDGDKIIITSFDGGVYNTDFNSVNLAKTMERVSVILKILMGLFLITIVVCLFLAFPKLQQTLLKIITILKTYKVAYIMLFPTIILLLVFNYYPVFIAITRAFTNWNVNESTIKFIGFDNFRRMITEGYFTIGLKNLLIIVTTSFVKLFTVPLLVAELVFHMKGSRQRYWFRYLFVVTMVVPGIVGVLMWQNIYDPNIGLLNQFLDVMGLSEYQRVWLGDSKYAIWSIVFMGFPFINPFAFLVYYGGLINIPRDLFESAKIDGSNTWWNFTRIHMPLLAPQFKMLMILTFIGAIQDFTGILILTGGGPGTSTYVPGLEMYFNATKFGQYGYACALGLVMFIAILLLTMLNLKIKSDYSK